jgi:hypothetical protein
MHLPNGIDNVHFGGRPEEQFNDKVPSTNDLVQAQNGTYTSPNIETNGHDVDTNKVQISFPQHQSLDAVLDTVLAGWVILAQRYQRDAFHSFTWGIKNAGSEKLQCIMAGELSLSNHSTVGDVIAKVKDLRLKDVSLDQATVFLNDGTKEEVCYGCGFQGYDD